MRREMEAQKYLLWDEYVAFVERPLFKLRPFSERPVRVPRKYMKRSEIVERNRGVLNLYRGGRTYDFIGRKYGISRQRVHQIISHENYQVAF